MSYGESMPYWPYRDLVREWLGAGEDDPELRVRVALRRAVERLFGDRTMEVYPYLGAMLGLALEPGGRDSARGAVAGGPAVPDVRGDRRPVRAARRRRAGRRRGRGPALGRRDVGAADRAAARLTERAAVLFVVAQRPERDHASWRVKETRRAGAPPSHPRAGASRRCPATPSRELLHSLVGGEPCRRDLERRVLEDAEGNPFYLEELVGSLVDAGALVPAGDGGWRFDHAVPVEVPETVEKVILARIDRLSPDCHEVLTAASVLGRRFGLPLLQGVSAGNGDHPGLAGRTAAARPGARGEALARARVPVQARPDPGGRLPDAAVRTPDRPAPARRRVAGAEERREPRRGVRHARPPLAGGRGRGQGRRLPHARRRPGAAGVRTG